MGAISAIEGVGVVAHDGRGRDGSRQAASGNNKATLVGHATGAEPPRYTPWD